MRYFLVSLRSIFVKDIVAELRAKQTLPTMLVLGALIVWVMRMACEAFPESIRIVGPIALWIAFLFSGLLAQERSFATEHQQDCIDGLLMAPVDEGTIYLSKLFVNIVMLSIFQLIIVPITAIAFKLDFSGRIPELIAVMFLGNVGISGVGTLFSAIVQLTRTKGSLLSVLVIAILMPMMIPASFSLLVVSGAIPDELVGTGALSFIGSFKAAIGYMCAFDAVFVTACWMLFGFAVKE